MSAEGVSRRAMIGSTIALAGAGAVGPALADREVLLVTTTPVKSTTTSVDMLGDVTEVGRKLGKGKKELLSAKAVEKEGILFYMWEFKTEDGHQLLQLCVNKGKLWSVDASAPDKRWSKVSELYTNSLLSFMPTLKS